jgi:magnesium transporter
MAELYLSRKAAFNFSSLSSPRSPPSPSLNVADAFSPSLASKTYAPRTATHTTRSTGEGAEDVEELEMLMEVYYSQIDVTLNKLNTVSSWCLHLSLNASSGVLAR